MLELLPFADEILHHQAKCHQCLKNSHQGHIRASYVNAPFTARLVSGNEQKLIGAGDAYVPLCRFHYEQHISS
jgi:thymidine kinase